MKLGLFIARRYLFSKKSTNAINIISGISMLVFVLGTGVTIILLSFLNGLEGLVADMNNAFDPDIRVSPIHSKVFTPDEDELKKIASLEGVARIDSILEENVVVRYGDAQEIAIMKGISTSGKISERLDTITISGTPILKSDSQNYAVFGMNIASRLAINIRNTITPANIFVPRRGFEYNHLNPENSLVSKFIHPSAIIIISEELDKDYVLVPLSFAREVLEYADEITALEISLKPEADQKLVRAQIQEIVGGEYEVLDRYMQNESAYTVFKTEKWVTFAILSFVILIAGFNVVGALTMLVLEKKRDISLLRSMGATSKIIRSIFLREGMLITVIGSTIGLILGIVFVYLQDTLGVIRLDQGIVEFWPVRFKVMDAILVYGMVLFLGLILSYFPAWKSVNLTHEKLN